MALNISLSYEEQSPYLKNSNSTVKTCASLVLDLLKEGNPNVYLSPLLASNFSFGYVRIANRVFKFYKDPLLNESCVMASLDIVNDLASNLVPQMKDSFGKPLLEYTLTSYKRKRSDSVNNMQIRILFRKVIKNALNYNKEITVNDVVCAFRDNYKGSYITKDQTITTKINFVSLVALVENFTTQAMIDDNRDDQFGRIDDKTVINLKDTLPSIIEEVEYYNIEHPKIYGKIKLLHLFKGQKRIREDLPFLPQSEIEDYIKRTLDRKLIFPGFEFEYTSLDGYSYYVKIDRITDLQTTKTYYEFENITCECNQSIIFSFEATSNDFTLGSHLCKIARYIVIKPLNIFSHENITKKEQIFFVDEIVNALRKTYAGIVWRGPFWKIIIKDRENLDYTFEMIIEEAHDGSKKPLPEQMFLPEKWAINSDTDLIIKPNKTFDAKFAQSRLTIPAISVYVEVKLYYKPNLLSRHVSKQKLMSFLKDHVKEIIEGEKYNFMDEDTRLFELTIKQIQIEKKPETLHLLLASIQQDTKFIFKSDIDTDESHENYFCYIYSEKSNLEESKLELNEFLGKFQMAGLDDGYLKELTFFKNGLKNINFIKETGQVRKKAILIEGPSGSGKSTLAKLLPSFFGILPQHIHILNPNHLRQFISGGHSEEAIHLFVEAQNSYRLKGANSPFYALILEDFDRLVDICISSNKSWRKTPLGMLLQEMENKEWPNLVVIGITKSHTSVNANHVNLKCFDLFIDLKLPTVDQRAEIFKIHLKSFIEKKHLAKNVNIDALAINTNDRTGQEIKKIIDMAVNYAINKKENGLQITREDFNWALRNFKPFNNKLKENDLPMFA